jgi:sulfur-oxidizing protein SoxX
MRARGSSRVARALALAALLPCAAISAPAGPAAQASPASGDLRAAAPALLVTAGGIASPLPGAAAGDAARGRAIVANRQLGLCLLCHAGPIPEERFQGNLAPDLQGAGQRWTAAQLRLRIVDASHVNPATIMPAYYKTEGLTRVAASYQGKTILTAQQIEDVVAWLQTLKEPAS